MKLGIDISQTVYKGTGVARFTMGLAQSILEYDHDNEWIFFFSGFRQQIDTELKSAIEKKGHRLLEWRIPPKVLSLLWNDFHSTIFYPKELKRLDWFITSDWTEPLLPGVKKATVVHDLVFKRYPQTVEENILKTQEKRLSWVIKETDLIFADSESTKNDIAEFYQGAGKPVIVNYPGVEVELPKAGKKRKPFILTVGKLEPRKNLHRLVKAFNKLGNPDLELVIAGPRGWQKLGADFKKENIRILEYVSDRELFSLYSTCLFFVFPSLWEGFGIPVIEAMKLGAPVACSNNSSVAEIADGAALTFNPEKTEEILEAMRNLYGDPALRDKLSKKGLAVAAKFTWKNYYDKMMKSIYDNRS